jgi:hypothetical protein
MELRGLPNALSRHPDHSRRSRPARSAHECRCRLVGQGPCWRNSTHRLRVHGNLRACAHGPSRRVAHHDTLEICGRCRAQIPPTQNGVGLPVHKGRRIFHGSRRHLGDRPVPCACRGGPGTAGGAHSSDASQLHPPSTVHGSACRGRHRKQKRTCRAGPSDWRSSPWASLS